jgi:hypothetical protein
MRYTLEAHAYNARCARRKGVGYALVRYAACTACTVYSVQCSVYSVQCTVYRVYGMPQGHTAALHAPTPASRSRAPLQPAALLHTLAGAGPPPSAPPSLSRACSPPPPTLPQVERASPPVPSLSPARRRCAGPPQYAAHTTRPGPPLRPGHPSHPSPSRAQRKVRLLASPYTPHGAAVVNGAAVVKQAQPVPVGQAQPVPVGLESEPAPCGPEPSNTSSIYILQGAPSCGPEPSNTSSICILQGAPSCGSEPECALDMGWIQTR